MSANLVNIIFGMKMRQARTEANMTLTEFAAACDLSPSYVTEIEKGRKYPRADKIMKIAEVLGKSYDDLVSIRLDESLAHLETTLASATFQRFPFEEFGLEPGDLVTLLTREPEKASALLHAVIAIARHYDLKEEEFLRAALRSYQEIHENYFQELEDTAVAFTAEIGRQYGLTGQIPVRREVLETILRQKYGYEIDTTAIADDPRLRRYRSVFVEGRRTANSFKPYLCINPALHDNQINFVLAREIGYQHLGLKERSFASTPSRIDSFQQILNDHLAAYFGGVLLMPRQAMFADLQGFFGRTAWEPQALLDLLAKYDATPEMLFYRFSELIPQFYGIRHHFLRFHQMGNERYVLYKQLNLNQLIVPHGIGLDEHYCRRWLSIRLLREQLNGEMPTYDHPLVGVQMSEFVQTRERFLCIGVARPLTLNPGVLSSVIIGFRVDAELSQTIRFADDPAIPMIYINETCERCPLTADQCSDRAAPPTILQAEEDATARRLALSQLRDRVRAS
ncbi:MAG: helix-turn-helix domain-containing protein [Chloroflexi bacterium]|nr:helix-turn-helix domain-containing protein [Ardenticatenaceae bacterium]NOG33581.1 helix-turn-helix domain-containing protein [Chloroflexota bacterium]